MKMNKCTNKVIDILAYQLLPSVPTPEETSRFESLPFLLLAYTLGQ